MIKNHMIKFLVDEDQFQCIKLNSLAHGHKTISSFLRDISLNKDSPIERMIREIHKEVVHHGRD